MLRLKSVERVGPLDSLRATYELIHSGESTTLDLEVVVTAGRGGFCAGMNLSCPDKPTTDEALDKLAEWLERSAAAIRERKTGEDVRWLPLGG